MSRERPNPLQWLWYAYGGRLPARCREWVLHDITCRTWALRHVARALVQVSPGLLLLLLPGPLWISAMSLLGGVIMAVWYSVSAMVETCEHRLAKHGYPVGTGKAKRAEANAELLAAQEARYAALYRNNQPEQQ
ncbi:MULTISPECIES: DUF5313 family protein [Actinopolyspora]|uniref:DUF5313 domain-containing protein n=1 Tax=Actinopolyspora saharensis TaxID=995062 RepID=A0A1H0ZDE2_9ACTN|nr:MULTISPECIES: DUF5313 family protein [Actinopolyspora]NHD15866.1 DUF5313 domain-containing protein [Actinopolyspora sp. BKK2]NHE74920.1 DUF5313 domain-containing protein [Actinopolyspora sp. BKK1]SDQ25171.1 hypothetical protein SAMN04489718_0968 [Actinopolyspora saharensis]